MYLNRLINFIEWLYGRENLLSNPVTKQSYPINVLPLDIDNPEQLLNELTQDTRKFPETTPLLQQLQDENRKLWNGRTFVFRGLSYTSGGIRMHCAIGHYFDAINTSSVLEKELIDTFKYPCLDNFDTIYKSLKFRYNLHEGKRGTLLLNDLWSSEKRSALLSISTLFAFNTGEGYHYYAGRRSLKLADGAGLFHIIPSLIFQPVGSEGEEFKEFSITSSILREIREELFSKDESTNYDSPEINLLLEYIRSGEAEIKITCLAMDLYNLRPEIQAVLIVHNSSWFEEFHEYISPCDEYDPDNFLMIDIDDNTIFHEQGIFSIQKSVPVGSACLISGLPLVRCLRDNYTRQQQGRDE